MLKVVLKYSTSMRCTKSLWLICLAFDGQFMLHLNISFETVVVGQNSKGVVFLFDAIYAKEQTRNRFYQQTN